MERAFGPQSHGMHAGTIVLIFAAHGSHRRCRPPSHLLQCTCSGRCRSMCELCVPAAEDNVCRRYVSPYGCDNVTLCLSTRQSRHRRSPAPDSSSEAPTEQTLGVTVVYPTKGGLRRLEKKRSFIVIATGPTPFERSTETVVAECARSHRMDARGGPPGSSL